MARIPTLHHAPLGYGRSGPLTHAAECPVPPTTTRLAIVRWMIENGSDVHQGGDAPLMRAALGRRVPMMDVLVSCGADVNAPWDGNFPIIFAACEDVDPVAIKWLLDHGANPNAGSPDGKFADTALDYVIGSYVRSPELARCIDILLDAGGITKYDAVVLDPLRGRVDQLAERIGADPALVSRRFPELDFGTTGGRMLTLAGATLLHVAAEYGSYEVATLLLDRGAEVNARSNVDATGIGGQTPIFHAATQFENRGLPMLQLLIERGADLSVRAKVPGHYERPGEVIECTALGYAVRFMDETRKGDKSKTVALLRAHGGVE
jgi:ankyrin repeat protein